MPVEALNGFYAGYFSAAAGEGLALLVIRNGVIVGVDRGGFEYDGKVAQGKDGYDVEAKVKVPPNSASITGIQSGTHGLTYDLKFGLPFEPEEQPFVRIETPNGPVNMRMVKLRELNEDPPARGKRQ
jgi:hypothetical protein